MGTELPAGWVERPIADATSVLRAGYWGGLRQGASLIAARVVRNGDVLEDGSIATDLPIRRFTKKEVCKAKLRSGDVLLVSSGNTGRVGRITQAQARPNMIPLWLHMKNTQTKQTIF